MTKNTLSKELKNQINRALKALNLEDDISPKGTSKKLSGRNSTSLLLNRSDSLRATIFFARRSAPITLEMAKALKM